MVSWTWMGIQTSTIKLAMASTYKNGGANFTIAGLLIIYSKNTLGL